MATSTREVATVTTEQNDMLQVEVYTLAGTPICRVPCLPGARVLALKRRIARQCDIPVIEQRLIHAGVSLGDDDALEKCCLPPSSNQGSSSRDMVLQCVRTGKSFLSRSAEKTAKSAEPDVAVTASVSSLVDTVLRAEHRLSESKKPRSDVDLRRAIDSRHRAELINWMVQAFNVVGFDDVILHSVVLTLDRYYAQRTDMIEVHCMQKVLLSAVCTELKLAGEEACPQGAWCWTSVINHLSHGAVELPAILKGEYEVLSSLGFQVGVPTALTFLKELTMHPPSVCDEACWKCKAFYLARFFLTIALFDSALQYCRPHVILAGGAFSAALRVLEIREPNRVGEYVEARTLALSDVTVYDPEMLRDSHVEVFVCEEELMDLWLTCAERQNGLEWSAFFPNVESKFQKVLTTDAAREAAQALMMVRDAQRRSPAVFPTTTPATRPSETSTLTSTMVSSGGNRIHYHSI